MLFKNFKEVDPHYNFSPGWFIENIRFQEIAFKNIYHTLVDFYQAAPHPLKALCSFFGIFSILEIITNIHFINLKYKITFKIMLHHASIAEYILYIFWKKWKLFMDRNTTHLRKRNNFTLDLFNYSGGAVRTNKCTDKYHTAFENRLLTINNECSASSFVLF